tara:strand:- start:389 stop:859 length:471 start_codon:yes stop_codon:yes gene_type:complete
MTWVIPVAIGAAQMKQQAAIGKFNQAVNERNAKVLEQEGEQIEKQAEFDILQFDKKFTELKGEQIVNTLKSGVTFEGTALRIARANEREKILQENIIRYNASIGKAKKFEQANFAIMSGQIAAQQSRLAQIRTVSEVGGTLLTMYSNKMNTTKANV